MAVLLFWLLWIVLCGRVTFQTSAVGLLLALALARGLPPRLGLGGAFPSPWRLLKWGGGLVGSILRANLWVAGRILRPGKLGKPGIGALRPRQVRPGAYPLLAAAITLTPGTLTLWWQGDGLWVHALDQILLEDLPASPLVTGLARGEGE